MAIQLPILNARAARTLRAATDATASEAPQAGMAPQAILAPQAVGAAAGPQTGLNRAPANRTSAKLFERTLRVGELARLSGKTVRALHLYEERGLLVPVERSKGGYRLYAQEALVRVRWISKLQDMGVSLNDIHGMLRQWEQSGSAPDAMLRVGELLRDKLQETREQIARLSALEEELRSSLLYLETCPSCSPTQELTACTSCELHEQGASAPDLVAGFHAAGSHAH